MHVSDSINIEIAYAWFVRQYIWGKRDDSESDSKSGEIHKN